MSIPPHFDAHSADEGHHGQFQSRHLNPGAQEVNYAAAGCPICPCPPLINKKQDPASANALFNVPPGFQALLKHITRELLNAKPKDPYIYICEYLRVKMHDRRRGSYAES